MYFRLGGSTIKGISKPGEIVWSRIYVDDGELCMDLGRGKAIELPLDETQRRWNSTTPQWPIMHGVTYGVSRDQMMAKHKANHIQVVYANDAASQPCKFHLHDAIPASGLTARSGGSCSCLRRGSMPMIPA